MLGIVGALDPFKHKVTQLRYNREQKESRLRIRAAQKIQARRLARARHWGLRRSRLEKRTRPKVEKASRGDHGPVTTTDSENGSGHEDNDDVFSWDDETSILDTALDTVMTTPSVNGVNPAYGAIGGDGLLLPSMVAGGPEDYYPTVAIAALMRVLTDAGLHTHHGTAVQAVVFIFRSLGLKCVPFLPQIVPAFLRVASVCERGLRENIFQHIGALVSIVKQHIRRFLPGIFALINAFWSHCLEHILSLIEEISTALKDEFQTTGIAGGGPTHSPVGWANGADYLASVVPRLLGILHSPHGGDHAAASAIDGRGDPAEGGVATAVASGDPSESLSAEAALLARNAIVWHPATEKVLHTLAVLGSNIGNYAYMVVPALVRLVDPDAWGNPTWGSIGSGMARVVRIDAPPFAVRKAAIVTLRKLCCTIDVSAFTSQVIHAVVRMLYAGSGVSVGSLRDDSVRADGAFPGQSHVNPAMQDALRLMHSHSELRRRSMHSYHSTHGDETISPVGARWSGRKKEGATVSLNPAAMGDNNMGPDDPTSPLSGHRSPSDGAGGGVFGYDSGGYPRLPSPYPLLHTLEQVSRPAISMAEPCDNRELADLREHALNTLCTLLHQLGPAFVAYIPLIDRALYALSIASMRQQRHEDSVLGGMDGPLAHHEKRGGLMTIDNNRHLSRYRLLVSKLLTNQPMPPQDGPAANMMVGLVTAMGTHLTRG